MCGDSARFAPFFAAVARYTPPSSSTQQDPTAGGLSVEETAEALDVSAGTVQRDWRLAKAWLARELKSSSRYERGDRLVDDRAAVSRDAGPAS